MPGLPKKYAAMGFQAGWTAYKKAQKKTTTNKTVKVKRKVTKRYKKKDGTVIVRKYDKKYPNISSKLNYYFPKWFDVLFPGGVPPYYLRHNRVIKVLDRAGREATIQTFGWEKEATLKHYSHKSKKMRKDVAKGLME